jgi:hypothetical protein
MRIWQTPRRWPRSGRSADAKRPFAGPKAVLAYLSRYTHRVAISHRRLIALNERRVGCRTGSASPEAKPTLKGETQDAILLAVAKARSWIDGIASGCIRSFAEIAEREGKVERHIRLLTPLAFIPPRTLAAIIDGTGPHDVTVTALTQVVPYRWDRSPAGQFSEQSSGGGR